MDKPDVLEAATTGYSPLWLQRRRLAGRAEVSVLLAAVIGLALRSYVEELDDMLIAEPAVGIPHHQWTRRQLAETFD